MSTDPHQSHGRAILETAKDHLSSALSAAPDDGWTAVEWAEAAGLLLDDANFPAVFAHHLGPVLIGEGRAQDIGDGVLSRYVPARRKVEEPVSAQASATSAPQVWGSASNAAGVEVREVTEAPAGFPEGVADSETRPDDDSGPWIP
jgi:hypothetical protein